VAVGGEDVVGGDAGDDARGQVAGVAEVAFRKVEHHEGRGQADLEGAVMVAAEDCADVAGGHFQDGGRVRPKGVGELGICGSGAAIANAVYNACGVRLRDYPLTPDKVLAALEAKGL
jgi:CO/xanthine dehydrogenase Mo-binding subunit